MGEAPCWVAREQSHLDLARPRFVTSTSKRRSRVNPRIATHHKGGARTRVLATRRARYRTFVHSVRYATINRRSNVVSISHAIARTNVSLHTSLSPRIGSYIEHAASPDRT